MQTINDRMELLVNSYFNGNKSLFAKSIGLAPTAISGYLGKQRRSKPSIDVILAILKAVPQVNCMWLLSGEGDMLKSNESKDSVKIGDGSTAAVNVSGTIHGGQNVTTYPADQEIKNLRALLDEKERIIAEKDALLAEKERTIQILLSRN